MWMDSEGREGGKRKPIREGRKEGRIDERYTVDIFSFELGVGFVCQVI